MNEKAHRNRDRVTVIIPTFNRAHLISRALQSVLLQTGCDLDIVVVDDGSTDDTKSVVDEVAQGPRSIPIRYLTQPNRGPAAARNLGIRESDSPFVAFLDSDDEWREGKLANQLDFFSSHADHLICQTQEIWIRNGRRVNPMKKHQMCGGFIFDKCLPLSIISPSCVVMRRSFFDQVGLFDETLPACEDYDLWLRASAKLSIGLIEQPFVVRYGGHADQRSQQFKVMDQFRVKSLLKLLDSGILDPDQRKLTLKELVFKCGIIAEGARKRGRDEVAQMHERVINEATLEMKNPATPMCVAGFNQLVN
jgi:glycosyltransferase involved in cell wall biosynthesis